MHSSKQGMRKGYHLSIEGIQKGCIFIKKKKTRYKSAVGKGKQKGETVNFHIGTALQNLKIIQLQIEYLIYNCTPCKNKKRKKQEELLK